MQQARSQWRHAAFLVVLVVASLPGTTSASLAPTPQPALSAVAADPPPDPAPESPAAPPLLLAATERDLVSPHSLEIALEPTALDDLVAAGEPRSVLEDAQVVAIYGYPGYCVMGELGCHDPEGAIEAALDHAAMYEAVHEELGTGRPVLPAFHLIVDVAQARPGANGEYVERMPLEQIETYVELAREHDLLIFLDIQIGWTSVMSGVERLEPFLVEPFVHLAIDPEFATESLSTRPGAVIGTLYAEDVNEVQVYLADLVREHDLPPKVLVIHQFVPRMLADPEAFDVVPGVEISIDMDGFGPPADKIAGYERYALADYSQRPAFKLFHEWDVPVMTPEEVMALSTPPDYVIYQ